MTEPDSDFDAQDQEEFNGPEPKNARAWNSLIERYERAGFKDFGERADRIEKLYASASAKAEGSDSEFQIFWANVQVLGPSIYARPPAPVVTPRFQDRDPLKVAAAELLERAVVTSIEREDIDYVMRLARDDLNILNRGVVRLRYEDEEDSERICVEHLHRTDFAHDPARNWKEVGWVAFGAWMTKREMRKRFYKTSGDAYKGATYAVRKDENDNHDGRLKARVWEIWSKDANKVVWVSPDCEKVLDESEPHLKLEGFFPCPRPAYGTVQRGDLIPIPDFAQYQDQVSEINDITARISLLTDAVKVRAFYPAGAGEIADAIEEAAKSLDPRVLLVPIANWNLIGNGSVKDMLVWLPIEMITAAIRELIEMRKQLIEDVYEISGLSDIMRGSTNPNETLGAQQLKAQNGSRRVTDRQDEMVRLARDIVRIMAEIMAENFSKETLLEMSQSGLPGDADLSKQVREIERQIVEAKNSPEGLQAMQQKPELVQQIEQKAQEQIHGIKGQISSDAVIKLLRDEKIRPFAFDIETDSTIAPDENAQKQRATEYVTAVSTLLAQAPIVQQFPQIAPVFGGILKAVNKQFRFDREMQATLDKFSESLEQMGNQPPGPNPEQQKAQADAQAAQHSQQMEAQKAQQDAQRAQVETAERAQALQSKQQSDELDRQIKTQTAQADIAAKQEQARVAIAQTQAKSDADARRADLDMQMASEKHGQEMQIGVLNIELLKTKIDQQNAATENAARQAEASIAVKTAPKPSGQGASA